VSFLFFNKIKLTLSKFHGGMEVPTLLKIDPKEVIEDGN
jgi:hypothetical protein